MASSIHIQKAAAGVIVHCSRENFSHSVVFTDEKNEVSHSKSEAYKYYRKELVIRSAAYSKRTKQKLQKNAITHLSAVVNLEQHHTLDDLKKIKTFLQRTLDTKVFQMSVHRDEGKLYDKKNDIFLTSGVDFFKNPDDDKLYFDKKYTKKIDMSKYEIQKNYHAHIEMMGIDRTGAAIKRNRLNNYYLSRLQTFTAKSLDMQRGINYKQEGIKAPRRLDVLEFKRENTIKSKTKMATQKLLNEKIDELKNKLKENKAARADYAELEALKKDLKAKIKDKDLSIEDLEAKLATVKADFNRGNEVYQALQIKNFEVEEQNEILKNQNKSLEEQKSDLSVKVHDLQEKSVSRVDMSDYEAILNENKSLKEKYLKNQSLIAGLEKELKSGETTNKGFFQWIKTKFQQLKKQILQLKDEKIALSREIKSLKLDNERLQLEISKSTVATEIDPLDEAYEEIKEKEKEEQNQRFGII